MEFRQEEYYEEGAYEEGGYHDGDGEGEEEYGGWGEIAVAPAGHEDHPDQVNCVRFDAAEESLWVGSAGGVVSQATLPTLARYSAVAAHGQGVVSLRSPGESVVSLAPGTLCMHYSGCVPSVHYNDEVGDMAAVELDRRGNRLVVGRSGGGLMTYDLATGRAAAAGDTQGKPVVALCGPAARGSLLLATADGYISLLDGRTGFRMDQSVLAHGGGFAAVDAHHDLIATAGYTARMGRPSLERSVKIFDVRMSPRMLAALPFAPGPSMLRFHPLLSGTLLVASAGGAFAMVDASGMSSGALCAVDTGGDALLCCDLSPSGECVAFGGAGGYVHLWAASAAPAASLGGAPPPTPEAPAPAPRLEEEDHLSVVPPCFPPDGAPLASDLDAREAMSVGLPPRVIDPGLLTSMKQSDFVGYIPNPRLQRGGGPAQAAAAVAALRNQRLAPRAGPRDAEAARAARAARRADAGGAVLPARYRRVAATQQTGVKFEEEFDFLRHNRTPFSGLENDLANAYANALVQVLFFTPPMRELALAHVPDPGAEFSLTGELSLLFRMLVTAGGGVCQASNLLRALRQSREAAALGLLEGVRGERGAADIVVETHKDRSLGRRCQRLARFLLEQLSKEAAAASAGAGGGGGGGGVGGGGGGGRAPPAPGAAAPAGPTPIEEVFALGQRQRTRCLSRPRPDQDKLTRAFQVDLQYPPPKERPGSGGAAAAAGAPPRPSFAQLLQRSLYTCAEMRAWFDPEVGYQLVRQEKVPAALPQVLVVSCGLEDRGDLAWWAPVAGGEPAAGRGASSPPRRPRARAWLPFALAITADPEGWAVEVEEAGSAAEAAARCGGAAAPAGGVRAVYELTAVVAHVVDEDEAEEAGAAGYEGHLLAHVRVPPAYYEAQQESPVTSRPPSRGPAEPEPAPAPPGSPPATPPPPSAAALDEEEPVTPGGPERGAAGAAWRPPGGGGGGRYEWLVFNDFHISPSLASEVAELYGGQKVPVLLYFSRADVTAAAAAAPPAPPTPALTPAAFLALCAAPPLQPARARLHRPAFVPLSPSEDAPRPGTLLALDAEFVAYSPPERVVRRGVEVEARPSRLGLGRVSVVRGEGPLAGTPLIDDYIRSVEPVFDHLTRYSGLLPGDLDPAHSRHHLTTLRAAYLKLRHLVDAGCVFVGHGLKKDFRMINIVVPPSQVVDTMDLFYSGRGRRLSLRFLSAYLLGAAIQGGSHDSVEDAVAALRLYRAYRGLAEEGRVEGALREMMEWGAAHGWDPSGWGQPPPHLAAAAPAAAAVAAARPAGTWGLR